MKINEKNLCVFATTPPYDLEGYLNKRGEVNKAWQKRFFVLKGNLLFYFERKGDKEPLGLIILEGCIIELAEDSDPYSFQIVFNGNRTYILGADSQETMELWMKSLTCAGYEYKKLLLAELQRQLEEIEGTQKKQIQEALQPVAPKPPPRRQNPFNRPAPPPPVFTAPVVESTTTRSAPPLPSVQPAAAAPTAAVAAATTTTPASRDAFLNGSGSNNLTVCGQRMLDTTDRGSAWTKGEFSFQNIHEAFREVIMTDIREYWKQKADNEKPLIEF